MRGALLIAGRIVRDFDMHSEADTAKRMPIPPVAREALGLVASRMVVRGADCKAVDTREAS